MNKLQSRIKIVTGLALVLFASLMACSQSDGDGDGSALTKREWAILQAVGPKYRNQIPATHEIVQEDGYDLLAVPNRDRSERLWIMLWPKAPPFYKQMPVGNYAISDELLEELHTKNLVSSTAYSALRSHVE